MTGIRALVVIGVAATSVTTACGSAGDDELVSRGEERPAARFRLADVPKGYEFAQAGGGTAIPT